MFAPIGGFPRPGDPGQPPAACPLLRQSGVFGFTDSMGTPDPNDDHEYFLACRSDGIHIIDATPQSGTPAGVQWSASASQVVIPATNHVSFVAETGWGYLGPRPAGASVTIPENVDPGLHLWLNGHNGTSFDPNLAYCPTSNPFPYPYTTKNTTNREAVAWYEPPPANNGQGRWYVYSINTLHAGIWVIPLRRNTATAYHYLEPDPALPDYWWTGAGLLHTSIAPLGKCHMIYLDAERGALWVTDDSNARTRGIQIGPGGAPVTATVLKPALGMVQGFVMDYQAKNNAVPAAVLPPHDAMPVGDRLFVSLGPSTASGSDGRIDVFDLPVIDPFPTAPQNTVDSPASKSVHSVYFDATAAPTPALWRLQEDNTANIERFSYTKGDGADADSATSDTETPFVQPLGYSQFPDKVHHIRGLGRTGFLAQYNDGISLTFLTGQAGEDLQVLGSFDTAFTSLPLPGNPVQRFLDGFLGAWDVSPGADSGVVYVSGGTNLGLAFVVKQGHLNRYWGSTPFTAGPAQGLHPVVVNPYGPPRVGGSLILRDANAGEYPTTSNNQPVSYRWTLCYSFQQDPISPDVTWTPAFVGGTPTPAMGARNLTTVFTTSSNAIGNDLFVFPALVGAAGDKYFVQMVVEEYSGANPTGRWAASRGTWFGLAP